MTAVLCFAAGFGGIVGSFLNVVIHRLPRGEPLGLIRRSRSECPGCGKQIRWFDNIPVLSYIALRGKCRACGCSISLQYPLVELATAALFALVAWRVHQLAWAPPLWAFFLTAAFVAVCFSASVIDAKHKILPDALTLRAGPAIAMVAAVAVPAISGLTVFGHAFGPGIKPGFASVLTALAGLVVGGGMVWLLRWIGTRVIGREAMGLGDVKFMAMAGLMLGAGGVVLAFFLGVVAGGLFGGIIWAVTRNREIPFGPFLAFGVVAVLLYGDALTHALLVSYPAWVNG